MATMRYRETRPSDDSVTFTLSDSVRNGWPIMQKADVMVIEIEQDRHEGKIG